LILLGVSAGGSAARSSNLDEPSPTPYPLATQPASLTDSRYFYIASPNDPHKHRVPEEVQTGPSRDMHIQCLDWSRAPRTGGGPFRYFLTTCECWKSSELPYHPATPAPSPAP
jgi:hypothetical protein